MKVQPVSEAIPGTAVDFPDYWVYYFEKSGRRGPEGGTYHGATFTYVVTGAHNVHEVFAWADANALGRTFIVYAVYEQGADNVLRLQLSGSDPNRPDDPHRNPQGALVEGGVEEQLVNYVRRFSEHEDFTLRGGAGPVSQPVRIEPP